MKNLFIILAFFTLVIAASAQDLRTDKKLNIGMRVVTDLEDSKSINTTSDVIYQDASHSIGSFIIFKDMFSEITTYPPKLALPIVERRMVNGAVGLSYGNDNYRLYGGIGFITEDRIRGNFGFYWTGMHYTVSAFTDFRVSDLSYAVRNLDASPFSDSKLAGWNYDIKIMANTSLDKSGLNIGYYCKSRAGTGFMLEYDLPEGIIINAGYGFDWQLPQDIRRRVFVGIAVTRE